MSVLIRDMDMPKNCGECQLRDSWICFVKQENIASPDRRDEDCPLTEVSE